MIKAQSILADRNNSSGAVLVLVSLFMAAAFGFAALVVDVGNAYLEDRRIQYGSDAAAMAGARIIEENFPADLDLVLAVAEEVAFANGITVEELQSGSGIQLGEWNGSEFTAYQTPYTSGQSSTVNAVLVGARRQADTFFSKIYNVSSLPVFRHGIASTPLEQDQSCLKPFGLEFTGLPDSENIIWGETMIPVGVNSPGNWGKLNIGGNMSSGTNFENAMLNNVCNEADSPFAYVGDEVQTAPGFAGTVRSVFEDLLADPDTSKRRMVFPVVTEFGNGSSWVEILSFLELELISLEEGEEAEGGLAGQSKNNGNGPGGNNGNGPGGNNGNGPGGNNGNNGQSSVDWKANFRVLSEKSDLAEIVEESRGPRSLVY